MGSTNSSNSQRLVEVARRAGAGSVRLIESAHSINWEELNGVTTVGLSAGASAPESLIEGVIEAFSERYVLTVRESKVTTENVEFKLPKELAS
jgi:4-hydroxy-3-methylbut-2-enyl diphosphate reductase